MDESGDRGVVTTFENAVLDAVHDVTGKRPSIEDSFADLGLDSIDVLDVQRKLEDKLGKQLTREQEQSLETLADLARAFDSH